MNWHGLAGAQKKKKTKICAKKTLHPPCGIFQNILLLHLDDWEPKTASFIMKPSAWMFPGMVAFHYSKTITRKTAWSKVTTTKMVIHLQ